MSVKALLAATAMLALAMTVTACSPAKMNSDPVLAARVQEIGRAELSRSPEEADIAGVSAEAFGGSYAALLNDRSMASIRSEEHTSELQSR